MCSSLCHKILCPNWREPAPNLIHFFCTVLPTILLSFEFGPDVYENFRKDPLAFFEQLDTMEPGDQRRSLRMIKAFIDLQEEAGGNIDFNGCVRIAFNRMVKGECILFQMMETPAKIIFSLFN